MNPLTLDNGSGFMESINSPVAFDATRKEKFLQIARKSTESGQFPTITALCKAVGVSLRTFERHMKADAAFKDAFREILLEGQDILEGVMFQNAQRPSGYMDRITWLRRHFPENWHPEHRIKVSADISMTRTILDAIPIDADPELSAPDPAL